MENIAEVLLFVLIGLFVVYLIVSWICSSITDPIIEKRRITEEQRKLVEEQRKLAEEERIKKSQKYDKLLKEAENIKAQAQEIRNQAIRDAEAIRAQAQEIQNQAKQDRDATYEEMDRYIAEKCGMYPHLAGLMADLKTAHYARSADYLKNKDRPALKEASRISELQEETKEIIKRNKYLEYKIAYTEKLFSEITDIFDRNYNNDNLRILIANKLQQVNDAKTQLERELQEQIYLSDAKKYEKAVSYFSEIKKNNPYFSKDLYQHYLDAFQSPRLNSALPQFLFTPKRIEVTAEIPSFSSGEATYTTTLRSCTCKDFLYHSKPCKHMIGLAIFLNATYNMKNDANRLLSDIAKERERAQGFADEAKAERQQIEKERLTAEKERSQTEDLLKVISEREQSYPWLADIISRYRTAKLEIKIKDTITKREMTTLLRNQEKKIALLENQLAVWKYQFPILEEVGDMSPQALASSHVSARDTGFVYNWLSEDEYQVLTSEERQEKWLEHYFTGKSRDSWSAGIKYERYIGYLCETKGYKVKYYGATMKLQDMGRDLIVSKDKRVYLIQCKRYSRSKEIHENSIFQLFGSLYQYRTENPNKVTVGVFVTSSQLSDLARECAKALNITLYENVSFNRYPAVKCNISKSGERIYHLPYDQQYDTISIDSTKGECYATYVSEAIERGFRHAYKYAFTE